MRARVVAASLLATVLLPAQPALGQDRDRRPSGKELREAYPLDPTPEPDARQPAASPTSTAAGPPAAPPADSGGGAPVVLLVVLASAATAGGIALLRLRSGREREAPVADGHSPFRRAVPLPSAAGAIAAMRAYDRSGPHVTGARRDRASSPAGASGARRGSASGQGPAGPRRAPLAPPDPHRAWTAEIEWRHDDGGSRFQVTARAEEKGPRAALAHTTPLQWPPTGAKAVQALTDAVEALSKSFLDAGWQPAPPGDAWYAKRFAWEPVPRASAGAPPQAAPAAVPRPGEPSTATGRFERRRTWPTGTEELQRCEIKWNAGYVKSRFQAVVHRPGQRRGRAIATSAPFKWLLMDEPDPALPEHHSELRRLVAALEAAGWEQVALGPNWYSHRFVWRRDEPPPDELERLAPGIREGR